MGESGMILEVCAMASSLGLFPLQRDVARSKLVQLLPLVSLVRFSTKELRRCCKKLELMIRLMPIPSMESVEPGGYWQRHFLILARALTMRTVGQVGAATQMQMEIA